MKLKQYTVRIEGFVTFTAPDGIDLNNVPMKIDVGDEGDCDYSPVTEVNDTEITEKELSSIVDVQRTINVNHSSSFYWEPSVPYGTV